MWAEQKASINILLPILSGMFRRTVCYPDAMYCNLPVATSRPRREKANRAVQFRRGSPI